MLVFRMRRSIKESKKKSEWKKLRSALMFTSHELIPPPPRPGSSLGIGRPEEHLIKRGDSSKRATDQPDDATCQSMMRGKSMPTLHIMLEQRASDVNLVKIDPAKEDESEDSSATATKLTANGPAVPNPIITITEHSPVASVQFFMNADDESGSSAFARLPLTRSQSDKNIAYFADSQCEAPGSQHFITPTGELSLLVVLKAVHSVSSNLRTYSDRATHGDNATSLRVCEGVVSVIKRLLDVGLLQEHNNGNPLFEVPEAKKREPKKRDQEMNIVHIFIDTLMLISKHLGCTHGECSLFYRLRHS